MKKKTWLNAVFVISFSFLAWFGTTPAKVDIIELALVLDGSGSLQQSGWDAQLDAYHTIFTSGSFYDDFVTTGDELYVSAFSFATLQDL